MGKVSITFETEYEVGDVVLFKDDNKISVGIIEGYYIDHDAGNSFWFNIRMNKNKVHTYSNGGDIGEYDIIGKLDGDLKEICEKIIKNE